MHVRNRRLFLFLIVLAVACSCWLARPMGVSRQSHREGDFLIVKECSREHRLLPLEYWGFGAPSRDMVSCGFSGLSVTHTRYGFFEIVDCTWQWSQWLPEAAK